MQTLLMFVGAFAIVIGFLICCFVVLELWRMHRCKLGKHEGHIEDGKLHCFFCPEVIGTEKPTAEDRKRKLAEFNFTD